MISYLKETSSRQAYSHARPETKRSGRTSCQTGHGLLILPRTSDIRAGQLKSLLKHVESSRLPADAEASPLSAHVVPSRILGCFG